MFYSLLLGVVVKQPMLAQKFKSFPKRYFHRPAPDLAEALLDIPDRAY